MKFLTLRAKLAFVKLRQTFNIAPILYHFDAKSYILIKTDISGQTICVIFSQLIIDGLG